MQYRIPLDDGRILVVTAEVEEAVEPDPTDVGNTILAALGIGRPKRTTETRRRSLRPAPPPEEDADDWLSRTSKESLKERK
jgi:hypothetical protein